MAAAARTACALIAAFAAAVLAPAAAQALPPVPAHVESLLPAPSGPTRGPLVLADAGSPLEPQLRDTIVDRGSRSGDVGLRAAAQFMTPDGYAITVRWGDGGSYGPSEAQDIVDFLGTLLHGNEMRALSVFVATDDELQQICGGAAAACYSPLDEELVVPGDPGGTAGFSREFLVAHEYGHHVANNRNNAPFPAFVFGPKYWATHERICPNVVAGRYEPLGNYYKRPGEAFAEAFAFHHYPDETPWEWLLPHPSPASYAALKRDTINPWHKRIRGRVRGSVGGRNQVDAFLVRTPLDGRLTLKLRGPRRSDLDLFVIARRKVALLARATGPGRRKRINLLICGRSGVRVLVSADHGGGRYTLKAARP